MLQQRGVLGITRPRLGKEYLGLNSGDGKRFLRFNDSKFLNSKNIYMNSIQDRSLVLIILFYILSSLYLDTRVIQSIQFKEIISHIIIPLLKQLSHSFRTAMLKAGFCFLIFYVQSSSSEPDTHIHVYVPQEKQGGKDCRIKNSLLFVTTTNCHNAYN